MRYLRLLLLPFSLLYGLVIIMRNWLYDAGLLKSRQFDLPVIAIGNLEVGGAGKSPMTEYLVRLLKDHYKIATLSRGYGRQTKGYGIATATATAAAVGDEPAQFKHKFPDITVAVCGDRVEGITRLKPMHQVIIMDDAYQHRAVKAGINILLFDYGKINQPRLLLPAGNMREPLSGRWRADALVVTKCPGNLSAEEQENIAAKLGPLPYQPLFFSSIVYQAFRNIDGNEADFIIDKDTTIFMLTGIANPKTLFDHLSRYTSGIIQHNYPDHHRFSLKNITKLAGEVAACTAQKKAVITTEKDAQRLVEHHLLPVIRTLPVLVLPIGVEFLNNGDQFDQFITGYVREYTANNSIH